MSKEASYRLDTKLLPDILHHIFELNEEQVKNSNIHSGFFMQENVASIIFGFCCAFKLTDEAKFVAIEMFDRFMCKILRMLNKEANEKNSNDIEKLCAKDMDQMYLRILSCVQLSSKVCSDHILKCSHIKKVLGDIGLNVSAETVLSSELKVMKYLNYRLSIETPFSFTQVLLEVLANNCRDVNIEILATIANKVLESFYCQRDAIYSRLYESMTGRSRDNSERNKFLVIEKNHLYLSASVIIASAFIYKKSLYETVLEALTLITKMDKCDLDDFSVILCHFSVGNKCEENTI